MIVLKLVLTLQHIDGFSEPSFFETIEQIELKFYVLLANVNQVRCVNNSPITKYPICYKKKVPLTIVVDSEKRKKDGRKEKNLRKIRSIKT